MQPLGVERDLVGGVSGKPELGSDRLGDFFVARSFGLELGGPGTGDLGSIELRCVLFGSARLINHDGDLAFDGTLLRASSKLVAKIVRPGYAIEYDFFDAAW